MTGKWKKISEIPVRNMIIREAILIDRENVTALKEEMKKSLSSLENQVFQLYAAGNGYVEIAEILGKTPKAVDNALRRIRKKMKRCFGES